MKTSAYWRPQGNVQRKDAGFGLFEVPAWGLLGAVMSPAAGAAGRVADRLSDIRLRKSRIVPVGGRWRGSQGIHRGVPPTPY
jgi:hypothetical protein